MSERQMSKLDAEINREILRRERGEPAAEPQPGLCEHNRKQFLCNVCCPTQVPAAPAPAAPLAHLHVYSPQYAIGRCLVCEIARLTSELADAKAHVEYLCADQRELSAELEQVRKALKIPADVPRYDKPPDICPECDGTRFISAGPKHFVCLHCSLVAELEQVKAALAMAWGFDAVRHILKLNHRYTSACECPGCKAEAALGEKGE